MRIQSEVTSITWIPSEAIKGMTKMPFQVGVAHYDDPPPDVLDDLEALASRRSVPLRQPADCLDRRRGRTHHRPRPGRPRCHRLDDDATWLADATFAAVPYPDIMPEPEVGPSSVRFVQTCGGRTGVPAPRTVRKPPFIQITAPTAWTTLALTIHADGRSEHEVVGASPFPRHWIYDADGKLAAKSGTIDFKDWYKNAFGKHSPVGRRRVARAGHRGGDRTGAPAVEFDHAERQEAEDAKIKKGKTLTEQGAPGDEMYLLLDGVLSVEVNGHRARRFGPRRRPRRARGARGRRAHRDAACRNRLQGGSSLGGRHRYRRAQRAERRASARGNHYLRILFCGVRGSTPAPGPGLRPLWREHVVCRGRPRR